MRLTLILGLALLLSACSSNKPVSNQQNSSDINVVGEINLNSNVPISPADNKKQVDYFAHLQPEHRDVLKAWLKTKPNLRPAVESVDSIMFQNKESAESNERFVRETLGRDGYQFYSVGDMNGDSKDD